jgi:hypothetical protein
LVAPGIGIAIALAEISYGLEVGHQTPGEPDELKITAGFALESTAGLDAIQIAVDVDLEQSGRVIGRPPGVRWLRAFETQLREIEFPQRKRLRRGLACLGRSTHPVAPGTTHFVFGLAH